MSDHEGAACTAQSLCDKLQELSLSESNNQIGSPQPPSTTLITPEVNRRERSVLNEHQERERPSSRSFLVDSPSTLQSNDPIHARPIVQLFAGVSTGGHDRGEWIDLDNSLRRPRHAVSGTDAGSTHRAQNDAPSFGMLSIRARASMEEGALGLNLEGIETFSGTTDGTRRNPTAAVNQRQKSRSGSLHPGRFDDEYVTASRNGGYRPPRENFAALMQTSATELGSSTASAIRGSQQYLHAVEEANNRRARAREIQAVAAEDDAIDFSVIQTRSKDSSGGPSVNQETLDVHRVHRSTPSTLCYTTPSVKPFEYRSMDEKHGIRASGRPQSNSASIQIGRETRRTSLATLFVQNAQNSLQARMGRESIRQIGPGESGGPICTEAAHTRYGRFRGRRGQTHDIPESYIRPFHSDEFIDSSAFEGGQRRTQTPLRSSLRCTTSFNAGREELRGDSDNVSQGAQGIWRNEVFDYRTLFANGDSGRRSAQPPHRCTRNFYSGVHVSTSETPHLPHLDNIRQSPSRGDTPGYNGGIASLSTSLRSIEQTVRLGLRCVTRGPSDLLDIIDSQLEKSCVDHIALREVRDELRLMLTSAMAMENAWRTLHARARRAILALELSERIPSPQGEHAEEDLVCVIDLHEIKPGDEVVRLQCMHVFHSECILPYLRREATPRCPIDRSLVLKQSIPYLPVWTWEVKK